MTAWQFPNLFTTGTDHLPEGYVAPGQQFGQLHGVLVVYVVVFGAVDQEEHLVLETRSAVEQGRTHVAVQVLIECLHEALCVDRVCNRWSCDVVCWIRKDQKT